MTSIVPAMDISLVVCTRNRAPYLAEALQHFARLKTGLSWEFILVDNESTDRTAEVLAGFAASSRLDVKVINERKIGLSAAHNAGWRQSSGRVVAFTDDDCYPDADYLDQVHRCFSELGLGYVGGRVLLFDPKDYPITIQPLAHRVDIAPHSYVGPGLIHGANYAFLRDVLERVEGFDERLGPGTELHCGDDVDILSRASAHGYAGAYDPGPLVFHHHRRSTPEDVRRVSAGYDIGRGAYFAKALMDRRRRRSCLWPAVRKMGGNIWRGEFAVMQREFRGAWKYLRG